ncbi:ABC transporter permease [Engelhardtia mirabilis]|uniref:Oligopeptide transport system permease protein OppB n=1 Tax=Engelhardtia mirabilis TaxID=2528011 RepID=A0A518BI86_9BACT|nr:Oligopeptide transport system permease protein OppB [Planctomycetes bacterium Pla133]QDV00979.1 Oligopeptide transport system permease protein OppB [Planctomycetes bacterium Pla86]
MLQFLFRRLLWFAITLFSVVTISFFLMRAVRGGPFDNERALHPAIEANLEARYHLDWPVWKQYLQYVGPFNLDHEGLVLFGGDNSNVFGGVLTGDLGPSFKLRDYTVNDIIGQSLPISIALGSVAMAIALTLGLTAGIVSALRRGTALDLGMRLFATVGIALPNFVIAAFLIIIFAFQLELLPVAGWGSPRYLPLPALALGAPFAAYIARLTRTGMLEVLSADYIRTARAKGLPEWLVLLRHAIKGGILPVVSYLGPATAGILTGSLVIERMFAIPGTGSHFVGSALNRDYTLAMGVTILYTVLVYGLNTLVDLAYTLLDPRIELENS